MEKTDALVTTIEMARAGLGFNPADALDCIFDLIGQEDPKDVCHDKNVERLLRLSACIWSLRQIILAPASAGTVHLEQWKQLFGAGNNMV